MHVMRENLFSLPLILLLECSVPIDDFASVEWHTVEIFGGSKYLDIEEIDDEEEQLS